MYETQEVISYESLMSGCHKERHFYIKLRNGASTINSNGKNKANNRLRNNRTKGFMVINASLMVVVKSNSRNLYYSISPSKLNFTL